MKKKTIAWDVTKTLTKLKELLEPGVVGFYRSIEVTEVLGVKGKVLTSPGGQVLLYIILSLSSEHVTSDSA